MEAVAAVVVGAGPVGLSLAIDLAQRLAGSQQRVLLLDKGQPERQSAAAGSRAICFAKRTLEIFDGLGVGQTLVDAGVSWNVGRVFFGDEPLYSFDLLPDAGLAPTQQRPAFINLQQYVVEAELVQRALALPNLEIRWEHEVTGLAHHTDGVALTVQAPDGMAQLQASLVAACDGSRSRLRALLGLETSGRVFRDRFLIADVQIDGELFLPGRNERWFWFDPPFHRGQSVLLHRQPGGVWRIDFQLGWQADPEAEKRPEAIAPRVQALLRQGFDRDIPFRLVWASVYTFACQRMQGFRHGRVLFAGDAAHGVSPFGARGANSGVQDADNLGWKLAAVLHGQATGQAAERLLDSYASEREAAADENLLHSSRATDFITPKSEISSLFRNAVLHLARQHPFARALVNSGRLSLPTVLDGSPLSTADVDIGDDALPPALRPGAVAQDAPLQRRLQSGLQATWLLQELQRCGGGCKLLVFGPPPAWPALAPVLAIDGDGLSDPQGLAGQRYGLRPGGTGLTYLLRPDGHVAARWRRPSAAAVQAAWQRALGGD